MKTLKFNFGLIHLLAILALSVFLTSCNKESVETDILEEIERMEEPTSTTEETYSLKVPDGMSDEEAGAWVESLSIEEARRLAINVDGDFERGTEWCQRWSSYSYIGKTVYCNIPFGCYPKKHEHSYHYVKYRTCWQYGYKIIRSSYKTDRYCRSYC